MLTDSRRSALLVIDVQSRLLPAVAGHETLLGNTVRMMHLAALCDVPVIVSEHCKNKIGPSDPAVVSAGTDAVFVQKEDFSVWSEGCLNPALLGGADQIVITGIEAHVCVLQTAVDLLENGYHVFVTADAVSSRHDTDKQYALQRIQAAGGEIVTVEMAAFEWLRSARHPLFKTVHREIIK